MPNITISLDEDLLKAGRRYAANHQTSINGLIRKLLEETVSSRSKDRLEESFSLMDQAKGNSKNKRWKREDLYDGQIIRGVRIENPLNRPETLPS